MPNSESNKRIAKNTILLYFRMFLTMGVSLYTSRIVLNTLGVEDFGIYNVVGGVVMMFSFLNSSMSSATQRFLSFELGKKDYAQLKKVFSMSVNIHTIIAVTIFILAETIGLWFLNTKLVIPDERMNAANWVYQFSIISFMLTVMNVPYNATIIAHERMSVYAYVSIVEVILKLIIVFVLVWMGFDKLKLYAVLVFGVSVVVWIIYKTYCKRNFTETNYQFFWEKSLYKTLINFSGWDLYGNMSVMARTQGVSILLNLFFGPILNAANGIAIQVQSAIMAFAGNVVMAIRPQIVKSYAIGDYNQTIKLVMTATKYTYILLLFISLPILLEMHFILNLWLKEVPSYTVLFCQYTLTFNFFANMSVIVISAIHATGKIKRPSLINGTLYLSVIPLSYVAFKLGGKPEMPYLINVIFVLVGLLSNAWTLNLYLPQFSFRNFIIKVIGICMLITLISGIIPGLIKANQSEGWFRFICVTTTSTLSIALTAYYIAMNSEMRLMVRSRISVFLTKHNI
ncbi:MAG TPA: oligosaccharide flippase family protein [Paludibacter sp.]